LGHSFANTLTEKKKWVCLHNIFQWLIKMKLINLFHAVWSVRRHISVSILQSFLLCSIAVFSAPAYAATSCAFNSGNPVNFGNYDVFALQPNISGVGSLTVKCQGGGQSSFTVTLSAGQSNNYVLRTMKSGGNSLGYNLYISAARTLVWGDGNGGSALMKVARNSTTTLSVFGKIPAGQDVAVGIYSDIIIATVNF
jgi:spore coat protein U-like protein